MIIMNSRVINPEYELQTPYLLLEYLLQLLQVISPNQPLRVPRYHHLRVLEPKQCLPHQQLIILLAELEADGPGVDLIPIDRDAESRELLERLSQVVRHLPVDLGLKLVVEAKMLLLV